MSGLPLACVVDASVAIKLFLVEHGSEQAQELFSRCLDDPEGRLFVPDLLFVECANVLWKNVRNGNSDLTGAVANLADLKMMELAAVPTSQLMERALEIACAHDITAYDACYIALAELRAVPLITADDRLAAKVAGGGFEIINLCQLT